MHGEDDDIAPATVPDCELLLDTLGYWMDVEALTPPGAEEDGETDGKKSFRASYVPDHDFPWFYVHRDLNRTFKHFVRFGIFSREGYQADLVRYLSVPPDEDYDTAPPVKTRRFGFAGVFEADHNGMPVVDSIRMPAFALAFESVRSREPVDLDAGLEEFRRLMRATFNDLTAAFISDGKPVDESFIEAVRDKAAETLTWLDDRRADAPVAIVRAAVDSIAEEYLSKTEREDDGRPKRKRRTRRLKPELPPIDSFYFEDLRLMRRAVQNGNPGLLAPFIAGVDERTDCTARDFVAAHCDAQLHPAGRWPAEHDLSLMQQVAVDLITRTTATGGLFSVNGPPGTGKTTLLMELVAAVIVRRAEDLCAFDQPHLAFVADRWQIEAGPAPGPVHALRRRLLDHLIVVASSNNGAVENVTRELPNKGKIDHRFLEGIDFFSATAEALLRRPPPDEEVEGGEDEDDEAEEPVAERDPRAWGLVSAVLGNWNNKQRFVGVLAKVEDTGPNQGRRAPGNIFRAIDEARRTANWPRARQAFLRDLDQVRIMQREIAELDRTVAARVAAVNEAEGLWEKLEQAGQAVVMAEADVLRAQTDLADAQAAFERADKGVDLLRGSRPARLRVMAHTRWQAAYAAAVATRAIADQTLAAATRYLKEARAARDGTVDLRNDIQARILSAQIAAEAAERTLATTLAAHPGLVTAVDVATEQDEVRRQQMLPGNSEALAEARARLFASALNVHLAFVCGAGELFDRNLSVALDMLQGRSSLQGILPMAAPHLWATLALVAPVISTTFASLTRTFRRMGAGSIPWLLIDEAGQSVPHHAAGGIWRARRAIVVGDPFQVEPIITLDRNADARLAERRGVPDRLRATLASAQTLADGANRYGAWITGRRGRPVWVGCPLTVHRRCVEPMFGIANRLAYAGSMVLGDGMLETEARLTAERPLLGSSVWIDVAVQTGGPKHFVPEQAEIVRRIALTFLDRGLVGEDGLPRLFVISPFRSMADGLRSALVRDLVAQGLTAKDVTGWASASVGTVHTFQGRQRETVVLALGGTSDGAIRWASATPHILNVAVTRAQRRLYLVGDRRRWMQHELVAELAAIDAVPLDEAGQRLGLLELRAAPAAQRGAGEPDGHSGAARVTLI